MKLHENQRVEFKESWQDDCLKTVAAFANTDGGILYQNMIDLWNQGPLPKILSVADLKKVHKSVPRNRLLAETFFKAGLIEGWGQGTLKIMEDFVAAGFPAPEFKDQFGGVSVIFHKKDIPSVNDAIVEKVGEPKDNASRTSSGKSSGKILDILREFPDMTIPMLSERLHISTRAIEKQISKLQETDRLKRIGSRKEGHWKVLTKSIRQDSNKG